MPWWLIILYIFIGILITIIYSIVILKIRSGQERRAVLMDEANNVLIAKMLTCPFCGKDAASLIDVSKEGDESEWVVVWDPDSGGCGCFTPIYNDAYYAIRHWNTRNNIVVSPFISEEDFDGA